MIFVLSGKLTRVFSTANYVRVFKNCCHPKFAFLCLQWPLYCWSQNPHTW